MTPEQLEAAARELCRLRGIDPDKKRSVHGEFPRYVWELFVDDIEDHLDIEAAIAKAKEGK